MVYLFKLTPKLESRQDMPGKELTVPSSQLGRPTSACEQRPKLIHCSPISAQPNALPEAD